MPKLTTTPAVHPTVAHQSASTSATGKVFLNEGPAKELLKEYTEKLTALREDAEVLLQLQASHKEGAKSVRITPQGVSAEDDSKLSIHQLNYRCDRFLELWKMLRPAAVNLAQYASGTIEHARIDQVTLIEMRLRLAEFEHNLHFLDSLAKTIKDIVKG